MTATDNSAKALADSLNGLLAGDHVLFSRLSNVGMDVAIQQSSIAAARRTGITSGLRRSGRQTT